jgi:hypothetical protein
VALPTNITTITVTGTYTGPDGTPLQGTVTLTPSVPTLSNVAIPGFITGPVVAYLDHGRFTVTVPCTDNTALIPAGWVYQVTENFTGYQARPPYLVALPHTLGPEADLAKVDKTYPGTAGPAATPSTVGPAALLSAANTWSGMNDFTGGLAIDGTSITAPPGTSTTFLAGDGTWRTAPTSTSTPAAAPVTSVNDKTGDVSLTAADVNAIATALVTTRGDLIAATGNGILVRLAAGPDGQVLSADAASPAGLKWVVPASAGASSPSSSASFRGAWNNAAAYAVGDVVLLNGRTYVATAAGTGNNPQTSTQLITTTPATADGGDGSAYEMGVKIRPSQDLRLTGVAFHKATTNTGPHTGRIWQLGKNGLYYQVNAATFAAETASGWQTVPLAAKLVAGGDYMVSVSFLAGHYSLDAHYFDTPVTIASITAPAAAGMYSNTPGTAPDHAGPNNHSYAIAPIWDEPNSAWWQEIADWQALPGFPSAQEAAGAYVLAQIGANGGIAGLDGTGKLLVANLPQSVVQTTIATAKGDLIAATSNAALTHLPAGSDGQVLAADSTTAAGLRWIALPTTDAVVVADATGTLFDGRIAGDTNPRYRVTGNGRLEWGVGQFGTDTDLYRESAAVLGTDGHLTAAGHAFGLWTPRESGLVAATGDPRTVSDSVAPTSGTVYLGSLFVSREASVTTFSWGIATAGAGPVAGGNWIALLGPSGAVLASVNVDARVTSTGLFNETITGEFLEPGTYRAVLLLNAATMPAVYCHAGPSAALVNLGIAEAATYLCASNGTGQAALPPSINLANNTASSFAFFAAIR